MHLEIISTEATLFVGEVTSVTVPGVEGEFQVLEHHADIISVLAKGPVKIDAPIFVPNELFASKFTQNNEKKHILQIISGTIEVKNNKVIVLVD